LQLAGSALRELHLDINHLTGVPPLPFPSRLTHLDLGQNMLTKLPSTLDRIGGAAPPEAERHGSNGRIEAE